MDEATWKNLTCCHLFLKEWNGPAGETIPVIMEVAVYGILFCEVARYLP